MSEDTNVLIEARYKKLQELKERGVNPFPNDFKPNAFAGDVTNDYGETMTEDLTKLNQEFVLAGRIMAKRDFGKASFIHIQDPTGKIQAYVQKAKVGEDEYKTFKLMDIGDIVGLTGKLFRTRTNELTLDAENVRLLSKSLRPLPEKWHGLTDIEIRYRQRYVDLMVNEDSREIFLKRSKIISEIRKFFEERGFLEVETPMMHTVIGGAAAKPFSTHHNTLDMDLYLRIAPELYLKRLVVGGLEKVFEINRNFRNEGISIQHNPEFTMLEFYQAYATFEDFIPLTEELFCRVADEVIGSRKFIYQDREIDLSPPWKRVTVEEAIREYGPMFKGYNEDIFKDRDKAEAFANSLEIELRGQKTHGKLIAAIFETVAESHLTQPTFVTHYPLDVSPLSRKNEKEPSFVDRFELYIYGREIANAFSELNDPVDQKERFEAQVADKKAGMDETMDYDEDYIRALEYGLPPTAGQGIGIDRMVMLFTNAASIRDVILFPLLRPER